MAQGYVAEALLTTSILMSGAEDLTGITMATGSMAPEDFLKQGQQLWEMLDEMAANSPENYQAFIQKHLSEGAHMFKPPQPAMALHCKVAEASSNTRLSDTHLQTCLNTQ